MFWKVNAIHQISDDEQNNVVFLIEGNNQNTIKTIFQKLKIVTLTMEEYKGNYETFGNYIIQFDYDSTKYNLVIDTDNIITISTKFMKTSMNIINISRTDGNLSEEEAKELLSNIKKELEEIKKKELEEKLKKEEIEEKNFGSTTRDKIAVIIGQTIEDIENLKEKGLKTNVFSNMDLKQLEEYKGELMKFKRGTNADKMTTLLEDVFMFMEKLEIEYLEYMKTQETKITGTSYVSDVDVTSEYEKRQRSKKVQQSGASKNSDDNYYILLGKIGLFIRFIQKDFLSKTNGIKNIINNLILYIEYIIIFLTIELAISISIIGLNQKSFYGYLINIGTLGFSITAMKILKFNNIIMIILRIILSITLYIIIYNFISTNLSI